MSDENEPELCTMCCLPVPRVTDYAPAIQVLERMAANARYRATRVLEDETADAEATDQAAEELEFEATIIERCANALRNPTPKRGDGHG